MGTTHIPHQLLLCTGNPGKVAELVGLLDHRFKLLTLADVGLPLDLPETGNTLEENALQKARYAFERTGMMCISDDTGLEVQALGGAPGVLSARYAGEAKDANANMVKLLSELHGVDDRRATFRTVIAMVSKEGEHTFDGAVEGTITHKPEGALGFGYDPIFRPASSLLTYAQMYTTMKNAVGHRGAAVRELVKFLM